MRELTEREAAAKANHEKLQLVFYTSLDELSEAFSGYKEFLDKGDIQGAKEYLRPMPESSSKTLMFRNILIRDELLK